ncbi:MAG: hypothetical protein JWR85_543 [Marmoricola sp.]|nr:hypothetical protein [Marmoricola sp.]
MSTTMRPSPVVATVIGDVVASRTSPDRPALHAALVDLLERANVALGPVVPLRLTVGDEFQGCFSRVGEALHATLWLRSQLAPEADLRHGVGWGGVAVLADSPRVEDGPGWWAAREAIEAVKLDEGRAGTRLRRTAYRRAGEGAATEGPDPDAVNAALMCRDQMVGSVSERSLRLLRGTLAGRSQAELAEDEGISPSAVSQRVRKDGLAVIVAADELLRRVG